MNPLSPYGPGRNDGAGHTRAPRAGRPQNSAHYPFIFSVADAETGAGLPDAVFMLTGAGGFSATANAGYGGVVAFAPLQPGEYRLKQTAAPPGYLPDMRAYTVTVNRFGSANVGDRPARLFHIRLARADGALRFTVRHAEDRAGTCRSRVRPDVRRRPVVQSAVSGSGGEVLFEGLRPGDYRLAEAAPPPGFLPMPDCVRVSVSAGGAAEMGGGGAPQTIENSPRRAEFYFNVADADSGLPAAGVRYALLGEDGAVLDTLHPMRRAALRSQPRPGATHCARRRGRTPQQRRTPGGFAVVVDTAGRAYIGGLEAQRFTARSANRAAVYIYKISDDGAALCGAQFGLVQDGVCTLTAETGETGVCALPLPPAGSYTLLETRPPGRVYSRPDPARADRRRRRRGHD